MEQLKFNNGKFTILSLGDLHEPAEIKDRDSRKRLEDMHNLVKMGILAFKPDLIVLLGDTCCDIGDHRTAEEYKEALDRILKPVIDSGIPFCYVLGNHEHDTGIEKEIVKAYEQFPTCIGKNDETAPRGDFNTNLLVKSSDGGEDILNLWFFDSNNVCDDESISKYDWVHRDQIEWYEKKEAEIRAAHGGRQLPSIVFQHIPVYEEYELLREAKPHERPVAAQGHAKFSDKYYVLKDGAKGYLGEGPCSPCINCGQFDSWKKTGDVVGAFFGHDHLNDFTGYVDGIMLGQNKTSGFRAYTDGCRCLVRTITIDENDPRNIKSDVHHFKELGLECHCLGPIEKRITDRQSINMHIASYAAAGAAAAAGLGIAAKKLFGKK